MTTTQTMKPSDEAKTRAVRERPVRRPLRSARRRAPRPRLRRRPDRTSCGILRARHAASDEPMITVAAQAADGPASRGRRRGRRTPAARCTRRRRRRRRSRRSRRGRSARACARRLAMNQRYANAAPVRSVVCARWCCRGRAAAPAGRAPRTRTREPATSPASRGEATTSKDEADARAVRRARLGRGGGLARRGRTCLSQRAPPPTASEPAQSRLRAGSEAGGPAAGVFRGR